MFLAKSTLDLWGEPTEMATNRTGKYSKGAHFTLSEGQVKGRSTQMSCRMAALRTSSGLHRLCYPICI